MLPSRLVGLVEEHLLLLGQRLPEGGNERHVRVHLDAVFGELGELVLLLKHLAHEDVERAQGHGLLLLFLLLRPLGGRNGSEAGRGAIEAQVWEADVSCGLAKRPVDYIGSHDATQGPVGDREELHRVRRRSSHAARHVVNC